MQDGRKTSEVANTEEIHEENNVKDTTAAILFPEDANIGLWSCQNLNGKKRTEVYRPSNLVYTSHSILVVMFRLCDIKLHNLYFSRTNVERWDAHYRAGPGNWTRRPGHGNICLQ